MAQINVRLPEKLEKAAEAYAEAYGFRNVQELLSEALREKVFRMEYDESFSEREIELVDGLISKSVARKRLGIEEELMKALG
jgi:Arc/MetJ-type ribon-helix-helix transcriptional regulator